MKVAKIINIDIIKYRNQLGDSNYSYTIDEKFKLHKFYDYFSMGNFTEAIEYSKSWTRGEREMIPCDIWDILFDISIGGAYQVIED